MEKRILIIYDLSMLLLVIIFALCVSLLFVGCAAHTVQDDFRVGVKAKSWLDQSIEKFLDANPDIKDPMPIGNGNYRYTYVHDINTDMEVFAAFASTPSRPTYRDDFYHIYLYVNQEGIIYKVNWQRKTVGN